MHLWYIYSLQFPLTKSIPVSLYMFVGCFICSDMYTIGRFLVIVLWKQCLRKGVACSCDKNTNLVAHFIGMYLSCLYLQRYYNVFMLVIVGSVLFIAAGYVAYPKRFKFHALMCLKNFLKAVIFMALCHLQLMLMFSGDKEVNPGPKTLRPRRTGIQEKVYSYRT